MSHWSPYLSYLQNVFFCFLSVYFVSSLTYTLIDSMTKRKRRIVTRTVFVNMKIIRITSFFACHLVYDCRAHIYKSRLSHIGFPLTVFFFFLMQWMKAHSIQWKLVWLYTNSIVLSFGNVTIYHHSRSGSFHLNRPLYPVWLRDTGS